MNGYYLDKGKKRLFIERYEIDSDNNELVIHLASGELMVVPYTEKNESKIIKIMYNQAEHSDGYESKVSSLIHKHNLFTIGSLGIAVGSTIIAFGGAEQPLGYAIGFGALGVASVVSAISNVSKANKLSNAREDIKKSNFFVENDEELNRGIELPASMSMVSKKTARILNSTPEDRPYFDINSIDSMPLEDLKTIKANIDRYKRFGFENPEVDEGKSRVLTPNK